MCPLSVFNVLLGRALSKKLFHFGYYRLHSSQQACNLYTDKSRKLTSSILCLGGLLLSVGNIQLGINKRRHISFSLIFFVTRMTPAPFVLRKKDAGTQEKMLCGHLFGFFWPYKSSRKPRGQFLQKERTKTCRNPGSVMKVGQKKSSCSYR